MRYTGFKLRAGIMPVYMRRSCISSLIFLTLSVLYDGDAGIETMRLDQTTAHDAGTARDTSHKTGVYSALHFNFSF